MYEIIKLHIGLVSAVIWLAKNKTEQNHGSQFVCKVAEENMIVAIKATVITTIASKLKMKWRHLLVSKDFLM